MSNLRNNIMRRTYYTFVINIATDPLTLHTLVLGFCFYILAKIVSIKDVWANMLEVKVGELVVFFWNAIISTELITQITLVILFIALVSLVGRIYFERSSFSPGSLQGSTM